MARPKLGRRLWLKGKDLRSYLSTRRFIRSQKDESFERKLLIGVREGENSPWSQYIPGNALLDTGSEHNLVTTQFLKSIGFEWEATTSAINIFQMDGTEIKILGEVQGRWHPLKAPKSDNFPSRFPTSSFKVVDLEYYDMIIGRVTINELELFRPKRSLFGGFRPFRTPVERMLYPDTMEAKLVTST